MTLLDKALAAHKGRATPRRSPFDREELLDLSLAFAWNKITLAQLHEALGTPKEKRYTGYPSTVTYRLFAAIRKGEIIVKKSKR